MMGAKARFAIGAVLIGSAVSIMYFGSQHIIERERTKTEIDRLRDGLYRARIAADRCRRTLINGQDAIDRFDGMLADMRARVDSFEALDPAGVPEAEYQEYLVSFESYNDSVRTYEARADQLRRADESCRATILDHNVLSDSLQSVLRDAGIDPG